MSETIQQIPPIAPVYLEPYSTFSFDQSSFTSPLVVFRFAIAALHGIIAKAQGRLSVKNPWKYQVQAIDECSQDAVIFTLRLFSSSCGSQFIVEFQRRQGNSCTFLNWIRQIHERFGSLCAPQFKSDSAVHAIVRGSNIQLEKWTAAELGSFFGILRNDSGNEARHSNLDRGDAQRWEIFCSQWNKITVKSRMALLQNSPHFLAMIEFAMLRLLEMEHIANDRSSADFLHDALFPQAKITQEDNFNSLEATPMFRSIDMREQKANIITATAQNTCTQNQTPLPKTHSKTYSLRSIHGRVFNSVLEFLLSALQCLDSARRQPYSKWGVQVALVQIIKNATASHETFLPIIKNASQISQLLW